MYLFRIPYCQYFLMTSPVASWNDEKGKGVDGPRGLHSSFFLFWYQSQCFHCPPLPPGRKIGRFKGRGSHLHLFSALASSVNGASFFGKGRKVEAATICLIIAHYVWACNRVRTRTVQHCTNRTPSFFLRCPLRFFHLPLQMPFFSPKVRSLLLWHLPAAIFRIST